MENTPSLATNRSPAPPERSYQWEKWTTWEYLPWWLANVPVYCFYAWFAARARHLFFFNNVNPAIPLGGAMGESKSAILALLPPALLPKTVTVAAATPFAEVMKSLAAAGLDFPVIVKPDVGERGFLIRKVGSADALRDHLERYPATFILQEFLGSPLEFSVLFHRYPGQPGLAITSVCKKEFLAVLGDGRSTVRNLMAATARASFQLSRFEREAPQVLERVPAAGERFLLEPIGNHCRGTKFLNANYLIDKRLIEAFEPLCAGLDGVFYGRFDLKCDSIEALQRGEIKVMELNGVFGEPAHVYDPSYGMWRAYGDLYRHWRILYKLHRLQVDRGVRSGSWRTAWGQVRNYFRYKKRLQDRVAG